MDAFEAIKYVGTPLALVAFVVVCSVYLYKNVIRKKIDELSERRRLIETAPEKKRPQLIESTIRDFSIIQTETLNEEQKHDIVGKVIKERLDRFKIAASVVVIIAVILAAVIIIVTIYSASSSRRRKSNIPTARCKDGTISYSQTRSGTCSTHGGVAEWLRTDIPD